MSKEQTNPLSVATGQENESLATLLKSDAYSKRFEQVLQDKAPQFVSSLIAIGNTMKDVEPRSIIGAGMTAACLDLPIDKNLGFAWIVPFRDKHQGGKKVAQFQIGYRGYIQLGQRSSQYAKMNSSPINREVFKGWDSVGEPVLDWDQYDPDKEIWGYFFGFQLTNGFTKSAVWTKAKILAHAKRFSQSFRAGKDIWVDQFDGMAMKTVIANTLRKWGPMSIQVQRALTSDQAVMRDIDALPEYVDGTNEEAEPDKPAEEHPEVRKQREEKERQEKIKADAAVAAEKAKAEKAQAAHQQTAHTPAPSELPEPQGWAAVQQEKGIQAMEQKVEEQELAEAGLAPEQPKKAQNVVPMPEAEPEPEPEPEPEQKDTTAPEPPGLMPYQKTLKESVEKEGYTFDDLINTFAGKIAAFPKKEHPNCPKHWGMISEPNAEFCCKSMKGLLAAIKNYKGKK